jgi:hypothetical protein
MAYNLGLAGQIREMMREMPGLEERKMFGGVGYLVQGNMACGVHGNNLIVRVGAEQYAEMLSHPHARPFDLTGRPMNGWVFVEPPGFQSEGDLTWWVNIGVQFALALPPKKNKGDYR